MILGQQQPNRKPAGGRIVQLKPAAMGLRYPAGNGETEAAVAAATP
jgi:hypothetical protein